MAAGCSSAGGGGGSANSPIVICEIAATSGPFTQLGTDDELGAGGPEETATSSAAIPIANQLQTVLLGWQSGWAGQSISDANLHGYAFPGIGNVFFADDLATVTQLIAPRHYTRVAVIEDNSPGGLGNTEYTQSLESKYGFKVVASQIVNPGGRPPLGQLRQVRRR